MLGANHCSGAFVSNITNEQACWQTDAAIGFSL